MLIKQLIRLYNIHSPFSSNSTYKLNATGILRVNKTSETGQKIPKNSMWVLKSNILPLIYDMQMTSFMLNSALIVSRLLQW